MMSSFKTLLLSFLQEKLPEHLDWLQNSLQPTQDPTHGDYTIPCFPLARTMRLAPPKIAMDFAETLNPLPDFLQKVSVVGGYLNFTLNKDLFASQVLAAIDSKKDQYGYAPVQSKTAVVDFSSPNIGKELAFHHLRSTMIGNSLSRILEACGYKVFRINHLGDWGTQFGKLMTAYRLQNLPEDDATLNSLHVKDLNRLYVEFSRLAKADPSLEDQARSAFTALENGDPQYYRLWSAFKESTLRELMELYNRMEVHFDYYTGESFFNDKMQPVVQTLEQLDLLQHSQDRDVVFLEDEGLSPCLIRKSDGSTLYATRDLAAAIYRHNEYHFDLCLYVVDNGQSLHFKQVKAVLQKMGHAWQENMVHIPFGLILNRNAEGKWERGKTRAGTSSLLRDVLEAAQEKILDTINQKNPELPHKEAIAQKIGFSALVFNDLRNRRLMDIKFDWEAALSFEGDTGPYVQNAYVRLCSILRKSEVKPSAEGNRIEIFTQDPAAYALIQVLSELQMRTELAAREFEPYILAQYSLDISEAVHRFIQNSRVIGSPEQKERIFLVDCARQVLKNVFHLLGIAAIEEM
jgi:arginyl-tRNA synthetase